MVGDGVEILKDGDEKDERKWKQWVIWSQQSLASNGGGCSNGGCKNLLHRLSMEMRGMAGI